jgi:hypothetical protein
MSILSTEEILSIPGKKILCNDFTIIQAIRTCHLLVDKFTITVTIKPDAEVAELADALRSGRSELWAHEGSNPSFGTDPPSTGGLCVKVMVNLKMVQ